MTLITKVSMEKTFLCNFFGVVADRVYEDNDINSTEKMLRFQDEPSFSNASYFIASDISPDYKGANWRMVHCYESDFYFLCPDTDDYYEVKNESNGKSYSFDAVTFGVIVSLSAYVCMLYHFHSKGSSGLGIRYANDGKKLKRFFDSLCKELVEGKLSDTTSDEQKANISIMLDSVDACLTDMNY